MVARVYPGGGVPGSGQVTRTVPRETSAYTEVSVVPGRVQGRAGTVSDRGQTVPEPVPEQYQNQCPDTPPFHLTPDTRYPTPDIPTPDTGKPDTGSIPGIYLLSGGHLSITSRYIQPLA